MATKQDQEARCGFCGKSKRDKGVLVESTLNKMDRPPLICYECASFAVEALETAQKRHREELPPLSVPAPRLLKAHLDQYVIGQELAKRRLAVEVSNHFQRLVDHGNVKADKQPRFRDRSLEGVQIEKSNVVLLGPTGSGKTLLARALADKLKVPFAIGDATTLTEAGYVGEDVENLLLKLLAAADYDIEAAQRGIIYIDEIDKLRKTGGNVSITRDVSGEGVQQSLLKMIEGTISSVPPQGGRKHPEQQCIQIDTTNILFICGGAFVGLDDIIRRRLNRGGMGFLASRHAALTDRDDYNEVMREVVADDLEEFGLIPELVGRLPIIAPLDELSVGDLKRILVEPKNALLKQEAKKLAYRGLTVEFTDDAMAEIAEQAVKCGTGARALRSVVSDFMNDIHFEADAAEPGTNIVVDRDVVLKQKKIWPGLPEAA